MKEKRVLWIILLTLLVVDFLLLAGRRHLEEALKSTRLEASVSQVQADYANEEQLLILGKRRVPQTFPLLSLDLSTGGSPDGQLQIALVVSVDDCTNCIEDEVLRLNEIAQRESPSFVTGIQGFFIDESRSEMAQRFIDSLSPAPAFPMSIRNVLSDLPGATTPLVLVIRSRDGQILDAHKPIPEDLSKRDTFYHRWAVFSDLARTQSRPGGYG